jgi:hypothetical protein
MKNTIIEFVPLPDYTPRIYFFSVTGSHTVSHARSIENHGLFAVEQNPILNVPSHRSR